MPVFKARFVLPITSDPIRDGAVAVVGDQIAGVGEAEYVARQFPRETLEDLGNAAIIPGFVNCHTHLELTAFRGAVDHLDDDFVAWLVEITRLRKNYESGAGLKLSALLGASEAAAAGVTTIGDIARHGAVGIGALAAVGIRGVVFQETPFSPDIATSEADFNLLRKRYEELVPHATDLVETGISPHTPYTVSSPLFERITEYAIDNKIPLSIHAAESEAELVLMKTGRGFFSDVYKKASVNWKTPGKSSIEYLEAIGVLEAKPLLAHCVHVTADEIGLIEKRGAAVAHCPKSNAKFGHGIAPLREFLNRGLITGLGTDSMASNNSCDMFEETRFAGLVSRIRKNAGCFPSSRELLALATIGGAGALGIEQKTGSLDAGKQADLVFISLDSLGQTPVTDIYSTLVFSTNASAVTRTIVAGRTVFEDGVVKNVELEKLKDEIEVEFGAPN